MAKNYMQDVARMLGVELEEEFRIKETLTKSIYKITSSGLLGKCDGKDWKHENYALASLLIGVYHIIKLPWQPKDGDVYYRPRDYHTAFSEAVTDFWRGTVNDFALKEAGMIFKTKAECEAALPVLRKKYLGGDKNG